jgi:hypothetical protein
LDIDALIVMDDHQRRPLAKSPSEKPPTLNVQRARNSLSRWLCALKKGDVEVPSDFAGVVYTDMDERGAWKAELLREVQAAGYADLNWGKALA